jgi:hypothetical protein
MGVTECCAEYGRRTNWTRFLSYAICFAVLGVLWVAVPATLEGIYRTRASRTSAEAEGDLLGNFDSFYDGPQSWFPGSDEYLRNHMSLYAALTILNMSVFAFLNVVTWLRYFYHHNWTYGARLLLLLLFQAGVNGFIVWRPTPSGVIQQEPLYVYYAIAPIVTYSDSFVSARLAWYWTILFDWWRHGTMWFTHTTSRRSHFDDDGHTGPDLDKRVPRWRHAVASLFLLQSAVYPMITRQLFSDALVFNATLGYAAYMFVERVFFMMMSPGLANRMDSQQVCEHREIGTPFGSALSSGDAHVLIDEEELKLILEASASDDSDGDGTFDVDGSHEQESA